MVQQQTHQWGAFWGSWHVWGLCTSLFLLSSIRLYFFFMQQNHPWAMYLDAITTLLKCLHYSRSIGQVQIWYFECKIWAKCTLNWLWQDRYIHGLVDGSHFVLQSSASFRQMKLNICHAPFWHWGLANLHEISQGRLTPNTTVTLIEQS